MSAPKRIQRQRTTGWRMPEGAVYVGRPSRWGNPFRVGEVFRYVDATGRPCMGVVPHARGAVHHFEQFLKARTDLHSRVAEELAGRDLACWCPLDQACHADVLLRLANEDSVSGEVSA